MKCPICHEDKSIWSEFSWSGYYYESVIGMTPQKVYWCNACMNIELTPKAKEYYDRVLSIKR